MSTRLLLRVLFVSVIIGCLFSLSCQAGSYSSMSPDEAFKFFEDLEEAQKKNGFNDALIDKFASAISETELDKLTDIWKDDNLDYAVLDTWGGIDFYEEVVPEANFYGWVKDEDGNPQPVWENPKTGGLSDYCPKGYRCDVYEITKDLEQQAYDLADSGNYEDALEIIEKILKLDPKNDWVKDNKKSIEDKVQSEEDDDNRKYWIKDGPAELPDYCYGPDGITIECALNS